MDAEILRDKPIRSAPTGQDPHERQVRHVLHWRQYEGGSVGRKKISHYTGISGRKGIPLTSKGIRFCLGLVKEEPRRLKWKVICYIPKKLSRIGKSSF